MSSIHLQLLAASAFAGAVLFTFWLYSRLLGLLLYLKLTGKDRLVRKWVDSLAGRIVVLALGSAGVLCFLWAWKLEPYRIEVTHHRVETSLLASGHSIRLVHLSDLHIDDHGWREVQLPEMVNAQHPDLVVMTGDYLNSSSPEAVAALREIVRGIKAPLGIYAVPGNWDHRSWSPAREVLASEGVHMISGANAVVEEGDVRIRVIGDTGFSGTPSDPSQWLFRVYLTHSPDSIEHVAGRVHLYLCGHTHGGQVRLPFIGALITLSQHWKRYEMGRYEVDGTTMYVHRGFGMEGGLPPRVRFLSPPEIAVFDVVGKPTTNTADVP